MSYLSFKDALKIKARIVNCTQGISDLIVDKITIDDGSLNTMELLAATTVVRRIMITSVLSLMCKRAFEEGEDKGVAGVYMCVFLHSELKQYYPVDATPGVYGKGLSEEEFHDYMTRVISSMEFIKKESRGIVMAKVAGTMSAVVRGETLDRLCCSISEIYNDM